MEPAAMGGQAFAYHRALAPMLWAFMALAGLELFVVHLLVAMWSLPLALLLSGLTVATMIWLAVLIRSFRRLPVVIDEDRLLMRAGILIAVPITWPQVAGVRGDFPGEALKSRAVLNLALLSYPNVIVDLREPIRRGSRRIAHVAHRLDDPGRFIAMLRTRLAEAREAD